MRSSTRKSRTVFSIAGEQAEVAAETDDVPRVDERAAFDAALQQVFDFGQVLGHGVELVGVDRLMAGR